MKLVNNYLYWHEGGKLKRAKYREDYINILKKRGIDVNEALTLEHRLSRPLYPYQLTAVNMASQHDWNLLIADAMGVGKTLSAIGCIIQSQAKKVLIVCPANIKWQWERNLHKEIVNCPHVMVCDSTNYELCDIVHLQSARIVLINYDILSAWQEALTTFAWDMMILDESQKIKNDSSIRTTAAFAVRERTKSCICLSGTPLTDRNADIYNTVKMVNSSLFPHRATFELRYCCDSGNSLRSVSTNTLELHNKLVESGTMIRRTKRDVYKTIPKVSMNIVPMNVGTSKLTELANTAQKDRKHSQMAFGVERSRASLQAQVSLEAYLQEAIRLKLPSTIKWIEDFLEGSGEKLIVACVHREKCGDVLKAHFGDRALLIDGSVTAKNKDKLVHEFITNDNCKLLIGNIQTIGTGLDGLQKVCNHMAVVEFCWSPADLQQFFARLDRNGQTEPVNIYFHVVYDSWDETLAKMLDKKSNILSEVLDGESIKDSNKLTHMIRGTK